MVSALNDSKHWLTSVCGTVGGSKQYGGEQHVGKNVAAGGQDAVEGNSRVGLQARTEYMKHSFIHSFIQCSV